MRRFLMSGTDLWVAQICLGTVNFTTENEKSAFEQMDCFYARGGNLFDTANIYGQKKNGDENRSEQVIGRWLAERGQPDDILISTKGGHPGLEGTNRSRLDDASLASDLDASRRAIGRDCLDLYFLHRDDPAQPVEALLSRLEQFRQQGKIRWYGLSNWRADRLQQALEWCRQEGNNGLAAVQNRWSLAQFNLEGSPDQTATAIDAPTLEIIRKYGLSVMAYAAMAKGFFTKLIPGSDGSPLPEKLRRYYLNDINLERATTVWRIAGERGLLPAQVALAWLLNQPVPVYPVVSFSSLRQLEEAMDTPTVVLEKAEMLALSAGAAY